MIRHTIFFLALVLWTAPALAGADDSCPDVPGVQKAIVPVDVVALEQQASAGTVDAALALAHEYVALKNYVAAEKWYRFVLYKGDGRGALGLYDMTVAGQAVIPDIETTRQYGFNLIEEDAKKSNGGSAMALGEFYLYGKYVKADYEKAREWFVVAETAGKPMAAYQLGMLYSNGLYYDSLPSVALHHFEKAAAAGLGAATRQVAIAYHTGIGVTKNLDDAITCYMRSAAQGDMLAMRDLGNVYRFERPNAGLAESWLAKAAYLGDPDAHYILGDMFRSSRPQEARQHFMAAAKIKHHLSRVEVDPDYVPHE